ncbi:MAG: hypothetical protein HKN64_08590, partial [Woeseiaceae bacterium]|nr:hypothetical protein [Woeseiaceae bacterium]
RSPEIYSWQHWLENTVAKVPKQEVLPTRINAQQSQLLWERCLAKDLPPSGTGFSGLARLSRDTWLRLADWQVPIGEVAGAADNPDQQLFAKVAGRYLGILQREHWVDDAGLAALLADLIATREAPVAGRITFAGFERERPVVTSIKEALSAAGCNVAFSPAGAPATAIKLQCFDDTDAEMRAAGAWARTQFEKAPEARITIVAGKLEQEATRITNLVREGSVPGWQYGPPPLRHFVNVSYGRKLSDFPAIAIALLLLRWLVKDLSAGEVGQLLRTPLLGPPIPGARSRLELRLRQLPDRPWSPAMLSAALGGGDEGEAAAWQALLARLTQRRRDLQRSASPATWAAYIDEALQESRWPGSDTAASAEFQLLNRWRDLLNDLARLALVSPAMSLATAIRRLELMAADAVFQPESETRALQLVGPLEAAGAEYDAIWISGLTAANWPPPGNPSPLVSRRLQRRYAMPDAEPTDTVNYARQLLQRLAGAAQTVVCSFAATEDDTPQTPSALLAPLGAIEQSPQSDPGWHASSLSQRSMATVVADRVPEIGVDERVAGGAGTLQRQLADPITAFIAGRLGVRSLQPQATGLPTLLRGNIIHDALYRLYADKPGSTTIRGWTGAERANRIDKALSLAFVRHEQNTDAVLLELFRMERLRVAGLLRTILAVDLDRNEFSIEAIEQRLDFSEAGVRLELRADRMDRLPDGSLLILDYKTGATKKFLRGDGQPQEIQLVAYACAVDEPVAALALVNIDSRDVSFSGAGHGFGDASDWPNNLAAWKQRVARACAELREGDVRISRAQGVQEARPFNLLSRYTELLRDG